MSDPKANTVLELVFCSFPNHDSDDEPQEIAPVVDDPSTIKFVMSVVIIQSIDYGLVNSFKSGLIVGWQWRKSRFNQLQRIGNH